VVITLDPSIPARDTTGVVQVDGLESSHLDITKPSASSGRGFCFAQ
jgi:hypothetical protein